MAKAPKWRVHQGKPPFNAGDLVTPISRGYHGWYVGDTREVKYIHYDEFNDRVTIVIDNPKSPYGESKYNPNLLRVVTPAHKRNEGMAYEKKQWIGLKIDPSYSSVAEAIGHPQDNTAMLNSQHEVRVEVAKRVREGDHWIVLETVAMIKGEPPRPPISVTEYK